MKEATMLYKKGDMIKTNEGEFDYIIVDACDVSDELKQGWYLTQKEALEDKPKRQSKAKAVSNELD